MVTHLLFIDGVRHVSASESYTATFRPKERSWKQRTVFYVTLIVLKLIGIVVAHFFFKPLYVLQRSYKRERSKKNKIIKNNRNDNIKIWITKKKTRLLVLTPKVI